MEGEEEATLYVLLPRAIGSTCLSPTRSASKRRRNTKRGSLAPNASAQRAERRTIAPLVDLGLPGYPMHCGQSGYPPLSSRPTFRADMPLASHPVSDTTSVLRHSLDLYAAAPLPPVPNLCPKHLHLTTSHVKDTSGNRVKESPAVDPEYADIERYASSEIGRASCRERVL